MSKVSLCWILPVFHCRGKWSKKPRSRAWDAMEKNGVYVKVCCARCIHYSAWVVGWSSKRRLEYRRCLGHFLSFRIIMPNWILNLQTVEIRNNLMAMQYEHCRYTDKNISILMWCKNVWRQSVWSRKLPRYRPTKFEGIFTVLLAKPCICLIDLGILW